MRSGLAIRPEEFDRPESRKLLINFAIMIAERQGQEETFFLHLIMLRRSSRIGAAARCWVCRITWGPFIKCEMTTTPIPEATQTLDMFKLAVQLHVSKSLDKVESLNGYLYGSRCRKNKPKTDNYIFGAEVEMFAQKQRATVDRGEKREDGGTSWCGDQVLALLIVFES